MGSRGWASACRLKVSLSCATGALPDRVAPVFVQIVSPPLGWSPLSSFLVIWPPNGDTRGPSVVFEAGDMLCPGPFRIITLLIISIDEFRPLPDPNVGLSILVCDVEHASFHFGLCGLSASYVIAGSTQELYTCLFRQMTRLLLKISRCLAYTVHRADTTEGCYMGRQVCHRINVTLHIHRCEHYRLRAGNHAF